MKKIYAILAVLMTFFYDLHIVFAIIISIIALFFNRGIVNLIVGYMPFKLRDVIDAKKSAMLINAAACMGAALMPYLTGLIMDYTNELGWVCYYAAMFITAIVSVLLLAFGILKQRKSEKNT